MEAPPHNPTMIGNLSLLNSIPLFSGDLTTSIYEFITQVEPLYEATLEIMSGFIPS